MYDLGDELTIDSYRIPWLIWIQLLVLFLLIFLLFCFSFSTSDPPKAITSSSPSSSSPSTSGIFTSHDPGLDKSVYKHTNSTSTAATKRCLHPQSNDGEITSGPIVIGGNRPPLKCNRSKVLERGSFLLILGVEDQSIKGEIATNISGRIVSEDLGSTPKDTSFIDSHPCNYFRLAKLAFLKCFGLDNLPENSSSSDRRKDR